MFRGNKIAIIPVKGTIQGETTAALPFFSSAPITGILDCISEIEKKGIVAAIFEINSGGGSPYTCKEIAHRIKNIDKPTVAWIKEFGASGAYWIASSCDKVVADELSRIGSIGATSTRPDFSELIERFGIRINTASTGRYKDTGLPFEQDTEEKRVARRRELDIAFKNFKEGVIENRDLKEDARGLFEGSVYLGEEAKDVGLIDYLGGKEKAIEVCKELAGIKNARIIDYDKKMEKGESIFEKMIEKMIKRFLR